MDDSQLLLRYAEEGSQAAFAELVAHQVNLVHSVALRRVGGDYHRAKDVTQMVFADLARKAAAVARHPCLVGWLHTSTVYAAARLMRQESRRRFRETENQLMNELLAETVPAADWADLRPVLDEAITGLGERDRAAVLWRYFNGDPLAAIGERLGVSENAARKRLERALGKLRDLLARRGVQSSAAALVLLMVNHAVAAAPDGLAEAVSGAAMSAATGAPFTGIERVLASVRPGGALGNAWLGAVAGLVLAGSAWFGLTAERRSEAALASANVRYGSVLQEQAALEAAAAQADTTAVRLTGAIGSARPRAAAPVDSRESRADFERFLAANPSARPMIIGQLASLAAQMYGSYFKANGLTATQVSRFEAAAAERWIQTEALSPDGFVVHAQELPSDGQLQALLGSEASRQLEDYRPALYAHYWAYRISGSAAAYQPVSGDQVDLLAQVLADAVTVPRIDYDIGISSLKSVDWNTALTEARPIFSGPQWQTALPAILSLRLRTFKSNGSSNP